MRIFASILSRLCHALCKTEQQIGNLKLPPGPSMTQFCFDPDVLLIPPLSFPRGQKVQNLASEAL